MLLMQISVAGGRFQSHAPPLKREKGPVSGYSKGIV